MPKYIERVINPRSFMKDRKKIKSKDTEEELVSSGTLLSFNSKQSKSKKTYKRKRSIEHNTD